jgi:hypothetical protein
MMMRKVCMCAGLEWWLISRKKDQVGVLINQINIQLIHHEIMRNLMWMWTTRCSAAAAAPAAHGGWRGPTIDDHNDHRSQIDDNDKIQD